MALEALPKLDSQNKDFTQFTEEIKRYLKIEKEQLEKEVSRARVMSLAEGEKVELEYHKICERVLRVMKVDEEARMGACGIIVEKVGQYVKEELLSLELFPCAASEFLTLGHAYRKFPKLSDYLKEASRLNKQILSHLIKSKAYCEGSEVKEQRMICKRYIAGHTKSLLNTYGMREYRLV